MKARLIIIFILLSFSLAEAQSITGSYSNISMSDFADIIKEQTGYNLYYQTGSADSIRISGNFNGTSLNDCLKKGLDGKSFYFSIDRTGKNIFITREVKIQTDLPTNFLEPAHIASNNDESHELIDAFQEELNLSKNEQLYEIGQRSNFITKGFSKLKGTVIDFKTGLPIVGASVYIEKPMIGGATNERGEFEISLPNGRHTLKCSAVGFQERAKQIILYSSGSTHFKLNDEVLSLNEVVIEANRDVNVQSTQMGRNVVSLETIKQIPMVMGEPDVMRVMTTFPGVKTVGEASTGFNVRGGSVDQNLILWNDGVIFNPSHLFGFFSAFNPDVVADVELYKSNIPAKYGGRLSSVLDVKPKFGNKEKYSGRLGVGPLTSRLTIEGPIKDKTSFIAGIRTTYSNWVLNLINNDDLNNSKASFQDISLNIQHDIDDKNILTLTSYFSRDAFNLRSDTTYRYNNNNLVFKWKRINSTKLISEYTAAYSRYKYNANSDINPVNAFDLYFDINEYNIKGDYFYNWKKNHEISFGLGTILHYLNPGEFIPYGEDSKVKNKKLQHEQALESSVYIEDNYSVSKSFQVNLGLRYSRFDYFGPKNVINYQDNAPKTEDNIIDTTSYSNLKHIQAYQAPEIRLALRYALTNHLSLKLGYNNMRQYLHMLSNTTAVSPTDIWKLSDKYIKPQQGKQLSFGVYKDLFRGQLETSIESYYKSINNYLDYKGGANLVMNENIEQDVLNTKGKAYGLEFFLKKKYGKLTGWISYTYSRIKLKVDDENEIETINKGAWYPANFDKPHDLTVISNYKFSHRFNVGLNATYSTGRPITLPVGKFQYEGGERVLYSNRNEYRIPDYFRIDLAFNIEGNHKVNQKTHNSWNVGVYNLTGRKNVYSAYFVTEEGKVNGYKLSIFGSAIPYINFIIRF
ncbi:TonB-dependent receptor [Fulvivirga ligni]|uniref:TonB-dependent receptor n=1 Tax=Fulvivirga ligni TaxID=2904246 RepID=UPI001F3981FE|nr:TonB-dependent receptor [Fulvivirga ligni]UII20170.1 TonB-dependent receptor [Fulvivirga ligni]